MNKNLKLVIYSILIIIIASLIYIEFYKPQIPLEKGPVFCPDDIKSECGTFNFATSNPSEYLQAFVKGSVYEKNESMQIYGACINSQGHPVSSSGRTTIRFPNYTRLVNNVIMGNVTNGVGIFNYTRRAPPNFNGNYFVTFNCTNGTLWASDFGEFQVPTFTDKINELFNQKNELNIRIKVLDRVFASEEFQVEAVFYNKTGAAINPDQIILMIYYQNDTLYQAARKTDFSQGLDNVWTYTKQTGGNPRFEIYSFHLTASKWGINATAPTYEARISSGGPFSIKLTCPATWVTGSDMPCTLQISDEGDTGVESICTTWIDSDNNKVADVGEPQVQTSQKTHPGDILTLAHTISIPAGFSAGDYIVRSQCIYVNSNHQPSTASKSLTLQERNIGGGGGGIEIRRIGIFESFVRTINSPACLYKTKVCMRAWLWVLLIAVILGLLWMRYPSVINGTFKWIFKIIFMLGKAVWMLFAFVWQTLGIFGIIGLFVFFIIVIVLLVKFGVAR